MMSAILLSSVAIHCKLMPKGEFIKREQKNLVRWRPILDLLQVCMVQLRVDELSVMLRRTGYGSLVTCSDSRTCSIAQ